MASSTSRRRDRGSGSPLGVLAIRRGDEVVVQPTLLPLATLLFLFGVLGARGLGGLVLMQK